MNAMNNIDKLTRIGDHNRKSLKGGRRLFNLFYGFDPHPNTDQMDQIRQHMVMGDTLADAVAQMFSDLPGTQGRKLLNEALENGIESIDNPPQALVALFQQVDQVPEWVDHEKITLACNVSRRVGISGELVLRNLALMGGYLGGAAAKPLVFTGQLDRMTPRRLVETGKFWMDVTTDGGLARDQEGFKSAVRVRVMHAQVRAMLLKSEKWDMAWGSPLNQWDSMATILEFSSIFLTGLRSIGFIFTKKEREAVIHLWRYIGYLMGVEEKILPRDESDSMKALYRVIATMCEADDDSRALGVSLADSPFQFAEDTVVSQYSAKVERILRIGYTRYILGDTAGDQLGLPKTKAKYFWPAQIPLRVGSEVLRMAIPSLNKKLIEVGERNAREMQPIQVKKTSADTTFTPVSTLAR
ncbi:hypothetical protein A9Q99_21325 [Gammaproteobacteria bacterium 45_16_T64]|nr:hypothetical protein A9Q99_21325 [Gammaproteobacteria bacterium 45_16_T64]